MPIPLSNRPKITPQSILDGYVMRYFVQLKLDTKSVVEIDEPQYNFFKTDSRYTAVRLPWIITGDAFDVTTSNGVVIQGTETKNRNITLHYARQIKNLDRYLFNPLEFFVGTRNVPTVPPLDISNG